MPFDSCGRREEFLRQIPLFAIKQVQNGRAACEEAFRNASVFS